MRNLIPALCVLSTSMALAAAPAAPDPWTKVPKPPTACYTSQDKYNEEVYAAIDAMNQEIGRVKEVNDQLKAQLDALDPMEKQTRMQNFLMQNPQEAAKIMQAAADQGTGVGAAINRTSANEQKLQDELGEIQSSYNAARKTVIGPLYAELKALGISESGTPEKTWNAGIAVVKRINAGYEKLCPEWWGAAGPFNEWLKRYKDHLIQNLPSDETLETAKAVQFTMLGIPADNFRSTAAMETVIRYMNQALKIFDHRQLRPEANLVVAQ